MPIVYLRYKQDRILRPTLDELVSRLPALVASALHVPGSDEDKHLVPSDVEVVVREVGLLDVNSLDLEIIIWANEYRDRRLNLEARKDAILEGVRACLNGCRPKLEGYVWVMLVPGSFGLI